MSEMRIPEFGECAQAVDDGRENPLERFIYENDLAGDAGLKFRKELESMLEYVQRSYGKQTSPDRD